MYGHHTCMSLCVVDELLCAYLHGDNAPNLCDCLEMVRLYCDASLSSRITVTATTTTIIDFCLLAELLKVKFDF